MRESVANLALFQSRKVSETWTPAQQDCAGLVRFVYRESLKARTLKQRNLLKIPEKMFFPTVSEASRALFPMYPKIWVTHRESGKIYYSHFADAETLVSQNFSFVSKNVNDLKKGDLLVYKKQDASLEPWHLMIYAGEHVQTGVVVYHNGSTGKNAQIRIVSLQELLHSPDAQWIPVEKNTQFLGVFKWNTFEKEKKF